MIGVTYPSAGGQSGSNYNVAEPGDTWPQSLTDYLVQLASKGLAVPSGGIDLDLGASAGIKALYFKTRTANPAASGIGRLANADTIAWRNVANNGDDALGVGGQDQLQWRGSDVTGNPLLGASTAAGQSITNGTTPIVVFGTVEVDTDSAYNSGTGRFTVPTGKGGHYAITASVAYANAQTGAVFVSIYKNAAEMKRAQPVNPGATQSTPVSAILSLAAGDIIDIRTAQPAGSPQALQATAVLNYFAIKRIPL